MVKMESNTGTKGRYEPALKAGSALVALGTCLKRVEHFDPGGCSDA